MKQSMNTKNMTRKDIAEMAGVSVSVVSRALNNSGYVAAEKKAKILRLAEEHNYIPHPVAMSLQQLRTGQILYYCKDLHNTFNIDLYYGMVEAARKRGYMAMINANVTFDHIRGAMVDGILLQNEFFVRRYLETYGKNYFLPVVGASFGNLETLSQSVPIVEWDIEGSMELLIRYLRKRGHRRIAYAGPYGYQNPNCRTVVWKQLMEPLLGERLRDYYLDTSASDSEGIMIADYDSGATEWLNEETYNNKAREAIRILLERGLEATAIVAFNDEFAVGLIQALEQNGKHVPDDISIVSFDGSYRSMTSVPRLVSVGPDFRLYGEKMVDTLVRRIEGQRLHYFSRVKGVIHEGDSVRRLR